MKTVSAKEDVLQLVTFMLENQEYAVDILKVQEINRTVEIANVPNSPSYMEGVINLRGKIIPVINLKAKLGFSEKKANEGSRIIVMDINGVTKGVLVDSVSEVLRISSDTVEPPPPILSHTNNGKDIIKGIAKLEDRLVMLVEIDHLIGNGG